MSIKELKEKHNALLDELAGLEKEKRSMDKKEAQKLLAEVEKIDETSEELRNNKNINTEVSYMTKLNEVELRKLEEKEALNSFVRKDFAGIEKRAQFVNTTEEG